MTRFLLFFLIFFTSPLAFAQDLKKDNYIEIGFGFLVPSDVSTEPFTGTSPSGDITYNNLRGNIEYDNPIAWSFEYGRYFNKDLNLRAGLNYTLSKAKLKRIYGTGSYTYNGITYNISDSLDRYEANNAESFDNNFKKVFERELYMSDFVKRTCLLACMTCHGPSLLVLHFAASVCLQFARSEQQQQLQQYQ